MSEENNDDLFRKAPELYNSPPRVPHERIWARIEAARADHPESVPGRRPFSSWRLWPIAAAATLILGIAIGRWMVTDHGTESPGQTAAESIDTNDEDRNEPYRRAAAPFLDRVETLLMMGSRTF